MGMEVASWNALMADLLRRGQPQQALQCLRRMQELERHHSHGLSPDAISFTSAFKACGLLGDLEQGRQIHEEVRQRLPLLLLPGRDVILATALVGMYARCGSMDKAEETFYELLPHPNVVSWNVLIAGYTHQGLCEKALDCFKLMQANGYSPDAITFSSILRACGNLQNVDEGIEIHKEILRKGLLAKDVVLGTALVDMYAKCGAIVKAEQAFNELPVRNVISWNAVIAGCVQCGRSEDALNHFMQMKREGFYPDGITLSSILKACGSTCCIDMGKQIHDEILRHGVLDKDVVLGTALVDMYAKCGMLERAEEVFHKLMVRDIVSWNALIAGYSHQEKAEEAFKCFQQMQSEGILADTVTFISILMVCGSRGAVGKGSHIHHEIISKELLGKVTLLDNALLDMYAKLSLLLDARYIFENLESCDVTSWNAMIKAYGINQQSDIAISLFKRMREVGMKSDAATFSCFLKACSRASLIREGCEVFRRMVEENMCTNDHMSCMLDVLARAGLIEEARKLLQTSPCSPISEVWRILLTGCKTHTDTALL